jgi:hypothetical protein
LNLRIDAVLKYQTSFAAAQATVTGRVVNAAGEPFPFALVLVGITNRWMLTESDGVFRLQNVGQGEHRMTISHPGTEPRGFSLAVPEAESVVDLGTLQLSPGDAGVRRFSGRITDAANGQFLSTAVVRVFQQSALTTDSSGRYVLDLAPLQGDSTVPLTIARMGYARRDTTIALGPDLDVALDFELQPSPLTLAGILVEEIGGAATSPRIRGFFDRRRQGFGDFFTAEQIQQMGAQAVTDVVRRVPGVSILTPQNVTATSDNPGLQADWSDRVLMSFNRGGTGICEPAVYIDDALVRPRNIDQMLDPRRLAAMAVYKTANSVPLRYRGPGAECGALVLWTRQLTAEEASPFEVGLGMGGFTDRGGIGQDWIGGYVAIPIHRRADLYPGFFVFRNNLSGYRFRLAGRFKLLLSGPVGLHVGPGLYFENRRVGRGLETFYGVLVGVPVKVGSMRVTAEAQWIDLANTTRLDVGFQFGVAMLSGN